jgi:hypothetical protein
MQPYQAWRRGLITYEEYLATKDKLSVSGTGTRTASTILTGKLNIQNGESWDVLAGESAFAFIGPTQNLVNEGEMNIGGDVLFQYDGTGITNSGTINITGVGTLQLKSLT